MYVRLVSLHGYFHCSVTLMASAQLLPRLVRRSCKCTLKVGDFRFVFYQCGRFVYAPVDPLWKLWSKTFSVRKQRMNGKVALAIKTHLHHPLTGLTQSPWVLNWNIPFVRPHTTVSVRPPLVGYERAFTKSVNKSRFIVQFVLGVRY